MNDDRVQYQKKRKNNLSVNMGINNNTIGVQSIKAMQKLQPGANYDSSSKRSYENTQNFDKKGQRQKGKFFNPSGQNNITYDSARYNSL